MPSRSLKRPSTNKSRTDELFSRACTQEESGNLLSAFRLYLSAAKLGDSSCQINLGNFYADGKGIKPNRDAAIYWYKRAYRQGERSAASNLGAMFRDEGKYTEALTWYKRAAELDDGDANVEIARLYLRKAKDRRKAIFHLKKVARLASEDVTEDSRAEASLLVEKLERQRL